jgi:L-ascorbate metabolism protein UlaG (beta-lactamase superfamily)
MPVDDQVSITWIAHGGWRLRSANGLEILIDPWLEAPTVPEELKQPEKCDVLVLTHAHFDHVNNAVEIARRHQPRVICTPEVAHWLEAGGVEGASALAGNKGGTVDVNGVKFTMVHAEHTSSLPDGSYGGEPVGFVITFENGFKLYFSGDTDVFSDMALIGELDEPQVAILPIGGFYTMDPRRAAKAAELLKVKTVIASHFGTFPPLQGRPAHLEQALGGRVRVIEVAPGQTV